jgi:hypothetical protein
MAVQFATAAPHAGGQADHDPARAIMLIRKSEMHSLFFRSTLLAAVVMSAALANPAAAQSTSDLKARCDQLTSYFDRYGASRSENTDGARNHTRIAAGLDCEHGHYAEGIASMESLLKRKNFDVPPAMTGIAQQPAR